MRIAEIIFVIYSILVMLWWIGASPESAPQQAALAGQALVLVCLPYTVLAILQRSRHLPARDEAEKVTWGKKE